MSDDPQRPDRPSNRKRPIALVALLVVAGVVLSAGLLLRRSAEELTAIQAALEQGAVLVDVRTPAEFARGHLQGAINVPIGNLRDSDRLNELGPKGKPLVVY